MKNLVQILLPCLAAVVLGHAVNAQTPAAPRNRVIGAVTAVDAASSLISIKTDAGDTYAVSVTEATKLLRLAPGERDLSKALAIQFGDIAVGDRVLAQGPAKDAEKTLQAVRIIDMSQADIAKKNQQEQADWQKRGTAGVVTLKDDAAGQLGLRLPSIAGDGELVKVVVTPKTVLKRYAPDSVKYSDAKVSTLTEMQKGDQIRVLGNKDEASGAIQAEQIVSGSFVTVAATVTSVDAAAGTILAKNIETGKPVTIKITAETNLRRMPQMGGMGGGMAGGAPGGTRPDGAPGQRPAAQQGAPWSGGGPGGAGGARRGGDFSRFMEFMPKVGVDSVKAGETIVVASSKSANPGEVTAITVLAGADGLVAMAQRRAAQNGRSAASNGPSMGMNLDVMSMVPMQ
ncbi:MAG: hypothetical protein P4K98_11660 [Bryobacteraceae bacterium]|nr:hypothetical protein [Bryobacteraceae bacterium]